METAGAMDPDTRRQLIDHYRDEIDELSRLLDRDLDGWLASQPAS